MSEKDAMLQMGKVTVNHKYLPILVSVLLCSLIVGLWTALKNRENSSRINTVNAQALKIADIINVDLNNRITSLQRVIKRWEVRGGTPKDEFISDVQSYIEDDPGYQALSWVDKTYHVRWIIPLAGNESAVNLNLAFEDSRRIALEASRDHKLPTLTSPIELVQGGKGFLVYFPIFVNGEFEGFLTAVFRVQEWLNYILHERLNVEDQLYFRNLVTMDDQDIFKSKNWHVQPRSVWESIVDADIYGHRFSIASRPTARFISQNNSLLPALVFGGGIVFSLLISSIVYLMQKSNMAVNTITASKERIEHEVIVRKEVQESLLKERKRLNYILKATNVGTWEWNIQTGEAIFNERWANIVGYRLQELEPCSISIWKALAHADDLEISNELIQKHLDGRLDYYECESRMRHKDGHWIWVLDRGKISTWTDDGKPLLMFGTHTDITRQKNIEEQHQHSANHDALTDLPSLRLANDRSSMAIEMAKRNNTLAAFVFVDLDGFKNINDTHGHDAGDALLKSVAKRFQSGLRKTDTVARIGGDEFLLIITDLKSKAAITSIAEKMLNIVSQPVPFKDNTLTVGASFGIALYPDDGDVAQALLKKADDAMYISKSLGKNRYTFAVEEDKNKVV